MKKFLRCAAVLTAAVVGLSALSGCAGKEKGSGRGHFESDLEIPTEKIGDFDSELITEFFLAFARKAEITLHFCMMSGRNSHHIAECAFKAFARALGEAAEIDERYKDEIPSTKGVL